MFGAFMKGAPPGREAKWDSTHRNGGRGVRNAPNLFTAAA